jgi:EAL domain-containing protein (putative c-di-GMP-specific phosphodiesterase class I)
MDQATITASTSLKPPSPSDPQRAARRLAARERRRERQRLTDALDRRTLQLVRTSRLRLADLSLAAEEVAVQWPHAGLSAAAALSSGAPSPITGRIFHWLLREAATTPAGPTISVLLPAAMLSPNLAQTVADSLRGTGLPPDQLELRLPETALLDPDTELLLALSALRDQGVRLALDEFGMRHGSTSLLRALPLTALHLDPSWTHDLTPNGENRCVAAALIDMAHALRLTVVARAIDSDQHLNELRALNVDEGTGPRLGAAVGVL